MLFYWGMIAASCIPVFIGFRLVLFRDWAEFFDAIGYWVKPDILSLFQGEYWDDLWAELKLGILMGVTAGFGFLVHLNAGTALKNWLGAVGLL